MPTLYPLYPTTVPSFTQSPWGPQKEYTEPNNPDIPSTPSNPNPGAPETTYSNPSVTTTGTSTPPATTDPDAPPEGSNPDETELKFDADGFPIALVYKYTTTNHKKGDIYQDFSQYKKEIETIGPPPTPDYSKVQDLTQTDAYTQLQALIDKLNDPNTTLDDYNNALDQVAKMLGIGTSAADYYTFMAGLQNTLYNSSLNTGQETAEQQTQTAQYLYAQRTDAEAELRKQTDAILAGDVGNSTNRAILTSNEIIRGINNDQITSAVQLSNMHLSQNLNAFNAQLQYYNSMYQNGQTSAASIVQAFQQNRLAAIQGYATELDAIYKQNMTYLQENEQALATWKANADNIYQEINTELGIDAFAQDTIKNQWDQWYTEQQAALQAQLDAQATTGGWFETLLGAAMIIGGCFIPGLGTALITGGIGLLGTGLGTIGAGTST